MISPPRFVLYHALLAPTSDHHRRHGDVTAATSASDAPPPATTAISPQQRAVPLVIGLVQLVCGPATHLVILGHALLLGDNAVSLARAAVDHAALWALALLLAGLLPSWRALPSVPGQSEDPSMLSPLGQHKARATVMGGLALYALLLPLLAAHGVHFHTARLVALQLLALGCGIVAVALRPRKWVMPSHGSLVHS